MTGGKQHGTMSLVGAPLNSDGPATASLDASLRRAAALLGVGWQAVMIWAVVVVEPTQPRWRLIAAHVALGLVVLLIVRSRRYLGVAVAAYYAMWFYDYYSSPDIDGVLFLATCWNANMTNVVVMLLGRWRRTAFVPVGAALACGLALEASSPIGSPLLTSTLVVTAAAIAAAGALAVPHLWALAEDADLAAAQAQEAVHAAALASGVAREAADDARILHDTVINTLAAIAIGGAAVGDARLVRERCRHDLTKVGSLVGVRAAAAPDSLIRIGSGPGDQYGSVAVRRTGLSDHDVLAIEADLSEPGCRALNAAARELVRNSVKHAGVDEVVIDVSQNATEVVVAVIDEGRGFDGVAVPGRGFDRSVVARMTEVGGSVHVDSAPGQGTRVVITCPLTPVVARDEDAAEEALPDPAAMAGRIRERACWLWSGGLVLVGIVIEAVNRPGVLSPTYGMLGLVAAAVAIAWSAMRRRVTAPRWLVAFLLGCLPPAFLAGMAGAGFGHGDVFHYQAWGVTPLLVMVLTLGRGVRPFALGLVLLTTTAVVAAALVARDSTSEAAVVVVGVAPAVGFAAAWRVFHRLIGSILRGADADRRSALRLRLETAAREAATTVRARWRAAELDTSLQLLEELANGELSPSDPGVRRRCGSEEAYLRQLTLLSPDAFRMAVPLTHALVLARRRAVDLVVRTGSVDAPDESTAAALGGLVLDAVGAVDSESSLTIGLFHGREGPRLTLVAPAPVLGECLEKWALEGARWKVQHQVLGDQEMIEIGWSNETELATDFRLRNAIAGGGPDVRDAAAAV